MINLYKALGYKSGKSITTAFNKSNNKALGDKLKPYDKLEYAQCVEVLECIGEYLAKTKQTLVAKLLDEYKTKVSNGVLAKEIKVQKKVDIAPPPVVVYKSEREQYSLVKELELIGFRREKYMDFPAIYIRFLKVIGHDNMGDMCNKFVNVKLMEKFKTNAQRESKESLEYFEFKSDFVNLLIDTPHLNEKFDKIHIEELIYAYKRFVNHSFALGFAEDRIKQLEDVKNSIRIEIEKESEEKEK